MTGTKRVVAIGPISDMKYTVCQTLKKKREEKFKELKDSGQQESQVFLFYLKESGTS